MNEPEIRGASPDWLTRSTSQVENVIVRIDAKPMFQYMVKEYDFDRLADASMASLYLGLCTFAFGIAFSAGTTLFTVTFTPEMVFRWASFLAATVLGILIGIVTLVLTVKSFNEHKKVVDEYRAQKALKEAELAQQQVRKA